MPSPSREYNFDGLVGPTHNYGGLSPGNVASLTHGGRPSNPREAALQGLAKMKFVASLGVGQAVLPPHQRPSLKTLRRLGFIGTDEEVITRAAREAEHLLRLCSSAAAMWTANAATCAPSEDTEDGRVHLTPANLQEMFHRVIEADTTWAVLRAIFSDERHFVVHEPLPASSHFADEGAANHTRLKVPGRPAVHLFAWGRSAWQPTERPHQFPARQTLEASQALARLHRLHPGRAIALFPQQDPSGIDAGAFHTDVLAVGNDGYLMLHERAFVDPRAWIKTLQDSLGDAFRYTLATDRELPVKDAVAAYPFNSQVLTLPDGTMAVVAPIESQEQPAPRRFLERVVAEDNPVKAVHYLDLRQSMHNGGGPACLRQRIRLTDEEVRAVKANVFFTDTLHRQLEAWVKKHYRDRLVPEDLKDPALAREGMAALDELTRLLGLGSVYDFQR
ncbi:MAG: N-succinylarginine dihydrolase [Myxococcaceae bacterium]|nr:N-succinylarginine dihydrolase [Myxococcaceae bacterium]